MSSTTELAPALAVASYATHLGGTNPHNLRGPMLRNVSLLLLVAMGSSACSQYRLASLQDVEIPNYEPRAVLVPASCEGLIQRAGTEGMTLFTESEAREVLFCQQQQIIRTQEEEAAAKRLEAHAAAARFALQTAGFVITGLFAITAWLFS